MKEKLAKLINVKSIVTIVMLGVFAYLSILGTISAEQFMSIFGIVIAFYFGTQSKKDDSSDSTTDDSEKGAY